MAMFDSLFNKGFKAAKCKTLLKLTIPRIKLLRNRREIQIKQMRRDIAKLLETGQEATARIRVEHIIREENMMAAQEIIELFCELIAVRLPIIEIQRECPLDLKEAISSVCFAAPRCADLPELLQVQLLFASKYGKEFVSAATELMPDCGVNRQLIELLSIRAPSPDVKLKLLKEIAEEHELDWDPAATETEFSKPHEDLLNGPTQFVSGSKLPLPKEKHEEALSSAPDQAHSEEPDSDTDFDPLDLPEVPKVSLRPSANTASAPEIPPSSAVQSPEIDHELLKSSGTTENLSQEPHVAPKEVMKDGSVANKDDMANATVVAGEEKQFMMKDGSVANKDDMANATVVSREEKQFMMRDGSVADKDDMANVTVVAGEEKQFMPFISPPSLSSASFPSRQSNSPPPFSRTKSEVNVDLQDVLAAAHIAAETAERAAAAARSAASLAQVRINELTKKKSNQVPEGSTENPFYGNTPDRSVSTEKTHVNHQEHQGSELSDPPPFDKLKMGGDSPIYSGHVFGQEPVHHPPHRLTSVDEDSDLSYPNFFTSQNANRGSGVHSFTGDSESASPGQSVHQGHESYRGPLLQNLPSFDELKVAGDSPISGEHIFRREHAHHQPQRLPSMDDDSYLSYPNLFQSQNSSSNLGSVAHSFTDNSRSTHEL